MGYSRRTSNYLERIALSNPTHMMSMTDPIAIGVEILRIDSRCSLEKEFTELICMNPSVSGVAWHPMGWQLNLSIGLNRSLIN